MQISTLICTMCIQRLRDANSFKMMAIATEQQLLTAKKNNVGSLYVNGKSMETEVHIKTEHVEPIKIELKDQNNVSESSQWSYDAGSSVTECDFVDREADFIARFRSQPLKLLPTRSDLHKLCPSYIKCLEYLKGKDIRCKMIPHAIEDYLQKNAAKAKSNIFLTEKIAHISNARVLLKYSNITPFKARCHSGFPCFYCRIKCDKLQLLREHQSKEHRNINISENLNQYRVESFVVYVDVTDLKCNVCNATIANLPDLKSHLINVHKKKLYLEYNDRVIPFKLSDDNVYECQICGFNFETFGSIERHMNTHFRHYACDKCGAGFITQHRLKIHQYSHVDGNFPCAICKKVYTTPQKYRRHVAVIHEMVKKNKCPKCSERFADYFMRQRHMEEVHSLAPLKYKCNVCDKAFNRRYHLSSHMKRNHLEERDIECDLCSYKCYTNGELKMHKIKHSGERTFECLVCKKAYARKKTLREHMRIHNDDRRFVCPVCGQAFVQKCSLKGHMKTHHTEHLCNL